MISKNAGLIYWVLLLFLSSIGSSNINADRAKAQGQPLQVTTNPWGNGLPSWSPDSKRIIFTSGRDGNQEIYVMNADGSGQTNLTNNSAKDYQPAWSPDGKKIAFVSDRNTEPDNTRLYVMNADGSQPTLLTKNFKYTFFPSWSPDSKRIAFEADHGIHVINADGSGLTHLQSDKVSYLAWSPDGKQVAFVNDGCDLSNSEIVVENVDGSGRFNLISESGNKFFSRLAWSPDGTHIVYQSSNCNDFLNERLYTINVNDSRPRLLTDIKSIFSHPTWSPSGQQIAFESGDDIYVINVDGSGRNNLTKNRVDGAGEPVWSPSGKQIVFVAPTVMASSNIYVMNADGSRLIQLTKAIAYPIH